METMVSQCILTHHSSFIYMPTNQGKSSKYEWEGYAMCCRINTKK